MRLLCLTAVVVLSSCRCDTPSPKTYQECIDVARDRFYGCREGTWFTPASRCSDDVEVDLETCDVLFSDTESSR